jgi:hypothetical protein
MCFVLETLSLALAHIKFFGAYLLSLGLYFYNIRPSDRAVPYVRRTLEYLYRLKNQQLIFNNSLRRASRKAVENFGLLSKSQIWLFWNTTSNAILHLRTSVLFL